MSVSSAQGADSPERKRRPTLGIERASKNSLLAGLERMFNSVELAEAQAWGTAICRARNAWDLKRKGVHHGLRR